jgi:hypothetical protein
MIAGKFKCINETYVEAPIRYFFNDFLIHDYLKERDGLSPLLFSFSMKDTILYQHKTDRLF